MPNLATGEPFAIANQLIQPGERRQFELSGAQLVTHTPLSTSIEVIHGHKPGPTLLVCAAIHGNEINGVEIIRRLRTKSALTQLSGTLVLVPVVNMHGFINQSRYLPDRRDLNRCFPGRELGSLGARTAKLFFDNIVRPCTHIIDLHTAAVHRNNLPQIRANVAQPEIEMLAQSFAIPVIVNAGLIDKSLRAEASKIGIPAITYEAGEALRLCERAIVTGVRGILNFMTTLGMLEAKAERIGQADAFVASKTRWYRANTNGMFRPFVALGSRVTVDQPLGAISSPFNSGEVAVNSGVEGIVIGMNNLPLVNAGDALFHIASFAEVSAVKDSIATHEGVIQKDPLFALQQMPSVDLS
ncbi:MAG: succinylglutamate desuccinylase/aspartoacylase family protein [Pseudomonadales bacterium]